MVTRWPRSAACKAAVQPATPVPMTRRSMSIVVQGLKPNESAERHGHDEMCGKGWMSWKLTTLENCRHAGLGRVGVRRARGGRIQWQRFLRTTWRHFD
jgi:hypothetical protein